MKLIVEFSGRSIEGAGCSRGYASQKAFLSESEHLNLHT